MKVGWRAAARLALLLVGACGAQRLQQRPAAARIATEDRLLAAALASQNDSRLAHEGESAALGESSRVSRTGDDLTVLLASGGSKTLKGNRAACDADNDFDLCKVYALLADLPSRHAFLVKESHFEGGRVLLIDDRSGRETELPGAPVFSPDNRRILVQDVDEAFGGEDNLEIWRRSGDSWKVEWRHPVKMIAQETPALKAPYEAQVAAWRGDVIDLAMSSSPYDPPLRRWTGRLSLEAGRWTLSQTPPPGVSAS